MSKPKFVAITDPTEIEELTADPGGLDKPFTHKPNGHLWVDPDQLDAWRSTRTSGTAK